MARRILLGSLFSIVTVLAHGRPSIDGQLPSVRLITKGEPVVASNVVWTKEGGHDGVIDIGLGSEFVDVPEPGSATRLLVEVKPPLHSALSSVRQRSVSYLNVSDEGPHMAVDGSERRSAWAGLKPMPGGRFVLQPTRKLHITMNHQKFASAFRDDPRWAALLAACKSSDTGACYTVTDVELEVTSTDRHRRTAKKIIRIAFPNGC